MHDSLGAARMAATGNEELPEFTWSYLARLERFAPPAFSSPAGAVLSMAVSPNSNWVATGHRDGTLSLWDPRTGLVTGAVAHTSGIRHIAFIEAGIPALTYGPGAASAGGVLGMRIADLVQAARSYALIALDLCCRPKERAGRAVAGRVLSAEC